VIVAVLNEEANIGHVMSTALSNEAVLEIIVADGGSDDGTVQKVLERARNDPRVKLLTNPDKGQATGLNRAALAATGALLIRLDGHTRYADDYVTASLSAWEPGVAVGGPMRAEGSTPWGRATASAMDDQLAIGPAKFHHADEVEDVDTVYLGTFEREKFVSIGGYRTFPSGTVEDTDFYARWRSSGGTVRVDPAIESWYTPRDTWRGLTRQYFRYGRGKAELVWLNGRLPSLRPLAPALLVAGTVVLTAVGFTVSWVPLTALGVAWLGALTLVSARAMSSKIRVGVVAGTMHAAYGTGLWWGLLAGRPTIETLGFTVEQQSTEDTSSR
jgi:glycosyltransferase involved in cell wall biosynthesis